MKIEDIKKAFDNNQKLIWNDPDPIEGNDYTIKEINFKGLDCLTADDLDDCILLIQYGEGSEAEVFPSEIALG